DSGSNWVANNGAGYASYSYSVRTSGRIYKASASSVNDLLTGFLGIANVSASAGNAVTVDMLGVTTLYGNTSTSTTYYLANTAGTLGTSAGTNSLKVGIGLGNAGLLLRPANF
ncbi:MAG: hypothetical protein AAB649_01650, partial [Patescibacteria group bacterium]